MAFARQRRRAKASDALGEDALHASGEPISRELLHPITRGIRKCTRNTEENETPPDGRRSIFERRLHDEEPEIRDERRQGRKPTRSPIHHLVALTFEHQYLLEPPLQP